MDNSTCVINGCEKDLLAKFLCSTHYNRLRITGSTKLRPRPKKKCRMPGCNTSSRKLGWCTKHHHRIKNNGSPFDQDQKWVWSEHCNCTICGGKVPEGAGYRKYCGLSCAQIATRGERPKSKPCPMCGGEIDLTERNKNGTLKYSSVGTCSKCRRPDRLPQHIPEIIARDGIDCSICDKQVDLSIQWPDPMYRSVDHVIPRSLGGKDHIENYALAHYRCNALKRDRIGWKITA